MLEKIKIRQFLKPLCAEQKTEGYVHVLPNNQAVINVRNLKKWRRYRDGTEIMRLVSSEVFPDPVRLIIRKEAFRTTLISSEFHPNYGLRGQNMLTRSLADALTQLYRFVCLNEAEKFLAPSFFGIGSVKRRDEGIEYLLPNNFRVVANASQYTNYVPANGSKMLTMAVDDVWSIEAFSEKDRWAVWKYAVYIVAGEERKKLMGYKRNLTAVLTLMLQIAIGELSVHDYVLEKEVGTTQQLMKGYFKQLR